MANTMADARRSLIRAREAAEKRILELEAERRELKASIKSLDAALKALERSKKPQQRKEPVEAHANDHLANSDSPAGNA